MTFVSRRTRPRISWSKSELDLLKEMCESGQYSYLSISNNLGNRPVASIRAKMNAMGLKYTYDYVSAQYGSYVLTDRMPGRAQSLMVFSDGTPVRYEDWV